MRHVIPIMVEQGRGTIISITSKLARMAVKTNTPYGPSKAALELLTLIVDAEFSASGIRANLLHPGGPVDTGVFNEHYQPMPGTIMGVASDIRDPAVWLASDESAHIHGALIDARVWRAERAANDVRSEG
jgi:3-oxoacyl-[acyl-carrier protein] reductase